MSEKARDAFKTISEVSTELDVPAHVLRFWETKFSTFRPLKRSGSRRYYRPDDVAALLKIRNLLYQDGFTIKGAQRFLKFKEISTQANKEETKDRKESESELLAVKVLLESVHRRLVHVKSQLN